MTNNELESAKNGAYEFENNLKKDLESGIISETEWFELNKKFFTDAYLKGDNPRAQSGHGGDEAHYANVHSAILQAIYKNGTLIDIGCANGYLVESLKKWTASAGYDIEFYGLDISEKLIDLAKKRLPEWEGRFFTGNALIWKPEIRFDYVLIRELVYVPQNRRIDLIDHLMKDVLKENGRFIIGPYTIEKSNHEVEKTFEQAGHKITGYSERSHDRYSELCRRMLWADG